jgi:hypothetical protein
LGLGGVHKLGWQLFGFCTTDLLLLIFSTL